MKHIILSIVFLTAMFSAVSANVKDEKLSYNIMYKWGLIHKKAGEVHLDTRNNTDGTFSATLTGGTAKWADRFYEVRDTLTGRIKTDGIVPEWYLKVSHEGGDYKRDYITYTRHGDSVTALCDRQRRKKPDRPLELSQKELKASGYTLDMLSAFYYMRHMDFPAMKIGDSRTMNIFSGKRKEILRITYHGKKNVEVAGADKECYYITFSFTSDGKKKSSDGLKAWISTGSDRIPYRMEGKLPVGSVKAIYVP